MTEAEYVAGMADVLVSKHGYTMDEATKEAAYSLASFLKEEKIQFGNCDYGWDDPAALVADIIAPYLEG